MKKLVKPKKYCEDNVEFYSGEVTPVTAPAPVTVTPTPAPPPSNSGGSNKGEGSTFLDILLSLLNP